MSERRYFRSRKSGDLGFVVETTEGKRIQLDRTGVEQLRPFDESDWIEEEEPKALTRHQVGIFAYRVDQELCKLFGRPNESRKEWQNLRDGDRVTWLLNGPDGEDDDPRVRVYRALVAALAEDTQP